MDATRDRTATPDVAEPDRQPGVEHAPFTAAAGPERVLELQRTAGKAAGAPG